MRIIPEYKVKFHKLHVLMLLVCISTESSLFTYGSHLQRFQPVQRNVSRVFLPPCVGEIAYANVLV